MTAPNDAIVATPINTVVLQNMLPTAKSLPASFRKALKVTLALVLLLLIVGFVLVRVSGLWGILFPSHQHDTVAPVLPELHAPAILVFSKTNSFRHVDGIEGGGRALKAIAGERDWDVFATENGAVFNDTDLGLYQAVVFLNATGDMLSERQELAFQRWLEAGGGWLGIHAAGDGSHSGWRWYRDNLIGADFISYIAICRDAICSNYTCVDLPLLHQTSHHSIGDDCYFDTVFLQFPRS